MPGQFEQLQQIEHRLNMAVCEHSPNPRLADFLVAEGVVDDISHESLRVRR